VHGVLEFEIGADVDNLTSAVLRLDPNGPTANIGTFPNSMSVLAYAGDGQLTGEDATRAAVEVGSATFERSDIETVAYFRVDLNEELLNSLLPSASGWLGFRLEVVNDAGVNPVSIEAGGNNSLPPSPSMLDLTWIS
jgi:hypothetical protein